MNSTYSKHMVSLPIVTLTLLGTLWMGNLSTNHSTVDAQVTKEMRSTTRVFPTTRPVEGRVVDEAGWPVVGAVVFQYGKSKGYGYSPYDIPDLAFEINNRAVTDLLGNFKFESYDFDHGNDADTYFAHPNYAMPRGYNRLKADATVLLNGEDVAGYILSHDGNPIVGAVVGISVPKEEITGVSHGRTETDSKGHFVLPHAAVDGRASMWLKIPGKHSQSLNWYADDSVKGAAEQIQRSPTTSAIGQEFELRIRPVRTVKISVIAEDSGQPIEIDRVMFRYFLNDRVLGFGIPIGHYEIQPLKNLIQYDYLLSGINRFWIFPKDDAQYPAVFIDVVLENGQTSAPDIEIKIPRGATISGKTADQDTGKPVANSLLEFQPVEPGKLLSAGVFPRQFVRTDSDGTFSVVMPSTAFKIQVVGDCGDYKTIPRGLARKLPQGIQSAEDGTMVRIQTKFTIPSELEKSVELESGKTHDIGVFLLEKGTKTTGTVVDSNGQPLANVGVLSTGNRYTSARIPFRKTDINGNFEIGELFTNAILDLPPSGRNKDQEPTADVFFYDVDRGLSKLVTVKESEANDIRVTLEVSRAAWGRVVDGVTGKPIPGVRIDGNGEVNRLILGATTDNDGSYLLEHLTRKGISVSFWKDGYQHSSERIQFLGPDENRSLLDVNDVKLYKEFAYGRPEKPNVTGLSATESVSELVTHIAKELTKLPTRGPRPSWSSNDPDTVFKSQLSKDVGVVMDRLLDENKDKSYQIAASLSIFQALSTSQGGEMITSSPQLQRMSRILLENLDEPKVFEAYPKFRFAWSSPTDYENALDNNQLPNVRL